MSKVSLKNQIGALLNPKAEKNKVTIYYINPLTGEMTIFSQSPSEQELDIQADSKETDQTYLDLQKIEKKE